MARPEGGFGRNAGAVGSFAAKVVPAIIAATILASCSESLSPITTSLAPSNRVTTTTTTTTLPMLRTLEVPAGPIPVIDGVLNAGEWDDATTVEMSDGTPILWMYAADVLYMAVNGETTGSVNLALVLDDQLWILHSSAALGSALYVKVPTTWELVHGFDWCCRSTADLSQRHALLEAEGWQANIGFTGDAGTVEYEIRMPWSNAGVAVSVVLDANTASFWPVDLGIDARAQLIGPRNSDVENETSDWFRLSRFQP